MSSSTRKVALSLVVVVSISLLGAGADKPGRETWCEDMGKSVKGNGLTIKPRLTERTVCGKAPQWAAKRSATT